MRARGTSIAALLTAYDPPDLYPFMIRALTPRSAVETQIRRRRRLLAPMARARKRRLAPP